MLYAGRLLVLAALLQQAAAATALLNPGFEEGTFTFNSGTIRGAIAAFFTDNTDWAGNEVQLQYYIDTDTPRSGNRALCINVIQGFSQTAQWVEQLPTGRRYSLSLWARVVSADGAVPVQLGLRKMGEDYDLYGDVTQSIDAAAGWVQLVVPGVLLPAAASTTGSLATGFMFWIRGTGTVCFDDASLREVIPVPEGELLDNPDFEDGSYPLQSPDGADISGAMANGGWNDNSDWVPGVSLRYDVTSTQAQGGANSLSVTIQSGFAQFAQWRTVPVATAYRLSVWVRAEQPRRTAENTELAAAAAAVNASAGSEAEAAAAAAGMPITLSLRLQGEPYKTFGAVSSLVSSQWVQLVVPAVVIPEGAGDGDSIEVLFLINTGGLGTVWLDTASMTVVKDLPVVTVKPQSDAIITRNYFGMNVNHMHEPVGGYPWPVVDFGLWRTWDSDIIWASVQPDARDSFDWTYMDKNFQQARSRNIKIMFTLGQTPKWASSAPEVDNVYGPGAGSVPRDIEDWKRFVRALLKRYGRWIHSLEVWNEPNMQGENGFYNGTPQKLAELALATQQVLKEVKSSALLINPPMAGLAADAVAFLRSYLLECKRLGVVHKGIAWHSYNMPAELDLQSMQLVRKVMADVGLPANLPIFNTEAGILDGDFKLVGNNHTFGAGFLARTYVVNWAAGVRTLFWYAYDNDGMEGLTRSTESDKRPEELNEAGVAYNNVKAWLTGARMMSVTRNKQGIWMASLLRGASSKSWIVWNGDQRVSSRVLTVPTGVKSRQDIITGARTSMKGVRQLPVTDVPLLLLA